MSNYNKLINNLETLKLLKIKNNIDKYIDLVNDHKKDLVDCLYELTEYEILNYIQYNLRVFLILKLLRILIFLFNHQLINKKFWILKT